MLARDTETELGFDPAFRKHLLNHYFEGGKLEPESYNVYPPDRERARDVVRYYWNGDDLRLEEHDTAAIDGRSYSALKRNYPRIEVLADAAFKHWLEAFLALVPPKLRRPFGTVGINLFRTHADVVSGPHQDDEEFCLVYVVDKHGGGAETSLYEPGASEPFYTHTLAPGELVIFDDRRFLHSASPLEKAADGSAPHRDVVVCTVNRPETYPFVPA